MASQPARQKSRINIQEPFFDLGDNGLPNRMDIEAWILGAVLLNGSRFNEIAELCPDDFYKERHRRILNAMSELQGLGEKIDRITVLDRLKRNNHDGDNDLSFLISLDEGIPQFPNLDSYIRIVRKMSALRQIILVSQKTAQACLEATADPAEILFRHQVQTEPLVGYISERTKIKRVEELESIFANRAPVKYLHEPELPERAIVSLTGDSESGKTTLACAWAREAVSRGHAVLILDRDKNPRDRICERLERLGVRTDGEFLRVWDSEQKQEAPQPDDPVVTDWVTRLVSRTSKSVIVIVDSVVSFFNDKEDENSAVDMRRLFNRCRALTKLGATVILIHHTNRHGEARGSSDFKPASDQAFLVTNHDRNGGRLLDVITLRVEKSRYGLSGNIKYLYAGGKMQRANSESFAIKTTTEPFAEILKANPGILTGLFEKLAHGRGLGRNRARDFLKEGIHTGTISVEQKGRSIKHYWGSAEAER